MTGNDVTKAMQDALLSVQKEIPMITWRKKEITAVVAEEGGPANFEAKSLDIFSGSGPNWELLVFHWTSDGDHGYDGTATSSKQAMVLHLPSELAEVLYDKAQASFN